MDNFQNTYAQNVDKFKQLSKIFYQMISKLHNRSAKYWDIVEEIKVLSLQLEIESSNIKNFDDEMRSMKDEILCKRTLYRRELHDNLKKTLELENMLKIVEDKKECEVAMLYDKLDEKRYEKLEIQKYRRDRSWIAFISPKILPGSAAKLNKQVEQEKIRKDINIEKGFKKAMELKQQIKECADSKRETEILYETASKNIETLNQMLKETQACILLLHGWIRFLNKIEIQAQRIQRNSDILDTTLLESINRFTTTLRSTEVSTLLNEARMISSTTFTSLTQLIPI